MSIASQGKCTNLNQYPLEVDSDMNEADFDNQDQEMALITGSASGKSAADVSNSNSTTTVEDIEAGLIYLKRLNQYYEVRA